MQNTHEVAQSVAPDARIVYVDNDPLVLVHARALMAQGDGRGPTTHVSADYHDPELILAEAEKVLDFSQPVGVMFMGVMGYEPDLAVVASIVNKVMAATPSGSYLVLWDGTNTTPAVVEGAERLAQSGGVPYILRSPDDIGTGLPTADSVHDVAQGIAPESRIVYVDNDPLVLSHARALLTSSDEGATAYIDADVREPEKILADSAVRSTLDWSRPIALQLVAIMHFVEDHEDPYGIVNRLVSALPSGSYLVLSHATFDPLDPETIAAMNAINEGIKPRFSPRTLDEVTTFFTGLELLAPGIVSVSDWRPEPGPRPTAAEATGYGAVARIP
jgi:hypothetical protein